MTRFDKLEGYCRMLGHYLSFQYCRTQQNGLPCSRILDCYFERIAIREFIDEHYTQEQQHQIFTQSGPKLHTIYEIMQRAKQNPSID